ncbi:MAG: 2-phosphosulfolactate phosphatase [Bacteroidota bacterium]
MAINTVDVCLSPELIHKYQLDGRVAVVVDILRATSCMTAGLAHGVKSITPFASLDACLKMKAKGYLIAGERNGQKVEGFDLGNSPFDYMAEEAQGKRVATTTTNGTLAIEKCKGADQIIIGSFLNISAVAQYLIRQKKNVLIVCAGWKGKVNMEDSLFAGALAALLENEDKFEFECDAPLLAATSYLNVKSNILEVIKNSSHAKRLNRLNVHKDIEFCLEHDKYDVVPVLNDGELVLRD